MAWHDEDSKIDLLEMSFSNKPYSMNPIKIIRLIRNTTALNNGLHGLEIKPTKIWNQTSCIKGSIISSDTSNIQRWNQTNWSRIILKFLELKVSQEKCYMLIISKPHFTLMGLQNNFTLTLHNLPKTTASTFHRS